MHIKMQHHKMIYSIMNDVLTCKRPHVSMPRAAWKIHKPSQIKTYKSYISKSLRIQLSNRPSACPPESLFRFILNNIIFGLGTILLGPSALSPDLHMLDAGMGSALSCKKNATSLIHLSYFHALYMRNKHSKSQKCDIAHRHYRQFQQ